MKAISPKPRADAVDRGAAEGGAEVDGPGEDEGAGAPPVVDADDVAGATSLVDAGDVEVGADDVEASTGARADDVDVSSLHPPTTATRATTATTPGDRPLARPATPIRVSKPYAPWRQVRSKGSRQAWGATSWWIALGPQDPGAYGRTGGGAARSGAETSQSRSTPSAVVKSV